MQLQHAIEDDCASKHETDQGHDKVFYSLKS